MVMSPEWWKRWPSVTAPDVTPCTSHSTMLSPSSATMPDSGRTQRMDSVLMDASPQRIDLGQAKSRMMAGIASASRSATALPGFSTTAK